MFVAAITRITKAAQTYRFAVLGALLTIVFIAAYVLTGPHVSLEEVVSESEIPEHWKEEREELHNHLFPYLGTRPKRKPDMKVEVLDTKEFPTFRRLEIRYPVEISDTATAFVFFPRASTRSAGIIALHQTSKDGKREVAGLVPGKEEYAYALELAEAGYAVIAPDDFVTGDRIPKGAEPYSTKFFYQRRPNWTALGKSLWDNRRTLDAFCSFPQVDCSRLAAVGHSQGGTYAWMLGAFDERIDVVVVNAGYGTLEGDPNPTRWARLQWYVGAPPWREFLVEEEFPFDFHEFLALIAPRALLVMGYTEDDVWPHWQGFEATAEVLEPLWEALEAENKVQFTLRDGPHSFPPSAHDEMMAFLRTHL